MKISGWNKEGKTIPDIQEPKRVTSLGENPLSRGFQKECPAAYQVELSDQAKEMKKIFDVLATVSDLRMAKVEAVKQAVQEGRYRVSSDAIAGKMMADVMLRLAN